MAEIATDTTSSTECNNTLVLITQGRATGRSEAALLSYRPVNGGYLVVATGGQKNPKPDWYLNLKEEPIVRVELGDASFHARATTPIGTDRVRLLPLVGEMTRNPDSIPRSTSAILLSPMC